MIIKQLAALDTTANLDDRNPCRDRRNDGRIIGGLGDSGRDNGRLRGVAGLAKGKGFVELRSWPEPSIGRRRPTPETTLLKG